MEGRLAEHNRRSYRAATRDSARAEAMWQMYQQGTVTYAEIGKAFGVTRERVRQLLVLHVGNALLELVRDRQRRRAAHRLWIETAKCRRWPNCFICGAPVQSSQRETRWGTCDEHAKELDNGLRLGATLRMSIDPVRHQPHRVQAARSPSAIKKYAGRPAYDPEVDPPNRRFVVPGSITDRYFREALEKGWPLADLIPDEIRMKYVRTTEGWKLQLTNPNRLG